MGYARIISGGPSGRYTVELDYGSSTRTLLLAAVTKLLAQIDNAISAQQVQITLADEHEAAQILKVQEAEAALIASVAGGLPPGSSRADTAAYRFEVNNLATLRKQHAPLRLKLVALNFDRAQAVRRAAYWTAFNPIETRQAWCTDFTEDATAGSLVATMDIPGESNLIVLAPGCRGPEPSDGELTAREVMSPEQVFLNAAILPGWQKFKPTYRWGTIASINFDADTCNVDLAPALSSAQRLNVNQAAALSNVPMVYSFCNAEAFDVGDRVVVQFIGQDWNSPRVIGFLDNPKACPLFPDVIVSVRFETFDIVAQPARSGWMSKSFNTSCGVFQADGPPGVRNAAPTAAHRITLASMVLASPIAGAEIESSVAAGTTLWTASSSAYQWNASDRVPSADEGTWYFREVAGDGISIRVATITAGTETLGSGYDSGCSPAATYTGTTVQSQVAADSISPQSIATWLLSISSLPEISVTVGSVTREYQLKSSPVLATSPTLGSDSGQWSFRYEPVPL